MRCKTKRTSSCVRAENCRGEDGVLLVTTKMMYATNNDDGGDTPLAAEDVRGWPRDGILIRNRHLPCTARIR